MLSYHNVFSGTDVLSSFLLDDFSNILEELFPSIIVPSVVRDELMKPGTPWKIRAKFIFLCKKGFIDVVDFEDESDELEFFEEITRSHFLAYKSPIDMGEAAVISMAYFNNGVVASNNLSDVEAYVFKYDLRWVTSSFILSKAYELGLRTIEELDKIYVKMKQRRRKLPADDFTQYYFEQYLNDKNKWDFSCMIWHLTKNYIVYLPYYDT